MLKRERVEWRGENRGRENERPRRERERQRGNDEGCEVVRRDEREREDVKAD